MYTYNQTHVMDMTYKDSFVRLWRETTNVNRDEILGACTSLFDTGSVYPYIAVMPDYHLAPPILNGSVVPTKDVLIPKVIGNDIGCGVSAISLPLKVKSIQKHLDTIYRGILKSIPVGKQYNRVVLPRVHQKPLLQRLSNTAFIDEAHQKMLLHQFGTLGGGNHFIEIQKDSDDYVWVMLHTGSRMLGSLLQQYYEQNTEHNPRSKSFLSIEAQSELGQQYMSDINFAVEFAKASRLEIMERVFEVLGELFPHEHPIQEVNLTTDMIDVVHNTVTKETHWNEELYIHRKGACTAEQDQLGIIPGSMGTSSFIVKGLGNPYSFCSSSHGAGRTMSRIQAKHRISFHQFRASMNRVKYNKDKRLVDEAPMAYKDVHRVMRGQKDLTKAMVELTPLLVVKGL
jgi:tRNA-splicing ligase RtcB